MNKEEIFSLIIMELVRRLSNEGENEVVVTNDEMNELLKNSSEVDFADSTGEQLVLKFIKFGVPVEQEIEVRATTPVE